MKKLLFFTFISILFTSCRSCRTTYIDAHGKAKPTWTARHMRTVHKHGFYAGGKWIEYKQGIKKVAAK